MLFPLLGWFFLSALPASAVPAFSPEPGVRLSTATPQQVAPLAGGLFRMYLVRNNFDVISATSSDQLAWSEEPGVRLTTGPLADADGAAISGAAVFPLSGGGFRMLYSAKAGLGSSFSILSATSTDGLGWAKETGVRHQADLGSAYIASPRVLPLASGHRLYYVRSVAGNAPANTVVASALSTDEGLTWTDEGTCLSTPTAEIAITTMTDGRVRLYYASLDAGTTVARRVLGALASDGRTFSFESGIAISTDTTSQLNSPVVTRSTEPFRWRLFAAFTLSGSTLPLVYSAVTSSPVATGFLPAAAFNTVSSITFTLSGEVFQATPTVTLVRGAVSVAATDVAMTSDLRLTGTLAILGLERGAWSLVVTNPDGRSGSLSPALTIDIPGGTVALTDNLFRPRLAQQAKIDITTFGDGRIIAKLYTFNGEHVKTVFDGVRPAGTLTVFWGGDTSAGNTVASGTYLLHVQGPKLKETKKIVVIK